MKPYYEEPDIKIYLGDCLEIMKEIPDNSIDACVTDPPYGLEFMGKEWDKFRVVTHEKMKGFTKKNEINWSIPFQQGLPRFSNQIQDKDWRKNYYLFSYNWAKQVLRILKPGGHLLSFGGTRTYHRMACGIEDAGFEIRDMIEWIYGQGFPKSLNIGGAILKQIGDELKKQDIKEDIKWK